MTALKRSLAREASGSKHTPTRPRRRPTRRHPIGASRLSCCPSPGVGNGKRRPQPSPSLPPQGGANKQLSDPNSLFAGSVSTRCARRDRPEAGCRPRYRKFESIPLQRRVCELSVPLLSRPEGDVRGIGFQTVRTYIAIGNSEARGAMLARTIFGVAENSQA